MSGRMNGDVPRWSHDPSGYDYDYDYDYDPRPEPRPVSSDGGSYYGKIQRALSGKRRLGSRSPSQSLGSRSPSPETTTSNSYYGRTQRLSGERKSALSKALIVGMDYGPVQGRGHVNDVVSLEKFLDLQGWDINYHSLRILVDHPDVAWGPPTLGNLISSLEWLLADARAGDALFFAFSGTGSSHDGRRLRDGPFAYVDNDVLTRELFDKIPPGVLLTCFIDSSSPVDMRLPFRYQATKRCVVQEVERGTAHQKAVGRVVVFSTVPDDNHSDEANMTSIYGEGGACINAMLSVLALGGSMSFGELLVWMRQKIKQRGLRVVPEVASTHRIDFGSVFSLWPSGKKITPLPGYDDLNPFLKLIRRHD